MTGTEAIEEFRHQHSDALREIKLHRYQVSEELRHDLEELRKSSTDRPDQNTAARESLVDGYEKLHDEITKDLTMASVDPELVFTHTLRGLQRVEVFRFATENLLEAVKRNESLNNSVKHYQGLGLLPSAGRNLED